MFFVIGLVVVIGSVLGGYMPHGDIRVLWQPFELLIILGQDRHANRNQGNEHDHDWCDRHSCAHGPRKYACWDEMAD